MTKQSVIILFAVLFIMIDVFGMRTTKPGNTAYKVRSAVLPDIPYFADCYEKDSYYFPANISLSIKRKLCFSHCNQNINCRAFCFKDDTCRLLNAWLDKKYSGDDHTETFAYDECYTTRDTEKNVMDPLTVTTTSSGMFTYQGLQFKPQYSANGLSCSHTDTPCYASESCVNCHPWLKIDLGATYTVKKIVIQGGILEHRHIGQKIRAGVEDDFTNDPVIGEITDFPHDYPFYEFELSSPMEVKQIGIDTGYAGSSINTINVCGILVYTE